MSNNQKFLAFAAVALLALGAVYFISIKKPFDNNKSQTQNQSAAAANITTEEKNFADWKVVCSKNNDTKKTSCVAQQIITVKQEEKDVPIATYQFMYGEKKELKLIQILPQGLLLSAGTSVIAADKILAPGKFTICQAQGCVAVSDVSKEDLAVILSAEKVSIAVLDANGKQANIVMSVKGLTEALEEIKK